MHMAGRKGKAPADYTATRRKKLEDPWLNDDYREKLVTLYKLWHNKKVRLSDAEKEEVVTKAEKFEEWLPGPAFKPRAQGALPELEKKMVPRYQGVGEDVDDEETNRQNAANRPSTSAKPAWKPSASMSSYMNVVASALEWLVAQGTYPTRYAAEDQKRTVAYWRNTSVNKKKIYDDLVSKRRVGPTFADYAYYAQLRFQYYNAWKATVTPEWPKGDVRLYWKYFQLALYTLQPPVRGQWGDLMLAYTRRTKEDDVIKKLTTLTPAQLAEEGVVQMVGAGREKTIPPKKQPSAPAKDPTTQKATSQTVAKAKEANRQTHRKELEGPQNYLLVLGSPPPPPESNAAWNPAGYRVVINTDKVSRYTTWINQNVIDITPQLADVLTHSLLVFRPPEKDKKRLYAVPSYNMQGVQTSKDKTDYGRPRTVDQMTKMFRKQMDLEAPIDNLRRAYATAVHADPSKTYNDMVRVAKAMRHDLRTAFLHYRHAAAQETPMPEQLTERDMPGAGRGTAAGPDVAGPSTAAPRSAQVGPPMGSRRPPELSLGPRKRKENGWDRKEWWKAYSRKEAPRIKQRHEDYYRANKVLIEQRSRLWELNNNHIKAPRESTLKRLAIKRITDDNGDVRYVAKPGVAPMSVEEYQARRGRNNRGNRAPRGAGPSNGANGANGSGSSSGNDGLSRSPPRMTTRARAAPARPLSPSTGTNGSEYEPSSPRRRGAKRPAQTPAAQRTVRPRKA